MYKEKQNEVEAVEPAASRQSAKIVAEMPDDAQMREQLHERQLNDGYPGSCGVPSLGDEAEHAER